MLVLKALIIFTLGYCFFLIVGIVSIIILQLMVIAALYEMVLMVEAARVSCSVVLNFARAYIDTALEAPTIPNFFWIIDAHKFTGKHLQRDTTEMLVN